MSTLVETENNHVDRGAFVQGMFGNIAKRYDLLNSLLSMGIHHRWKKRTIELAGIKAGSHVLDLCAGTSDIAILAASKVVEKGRVSALDFCQPMLRIGQAKAEKFGQRIGFINGDALRLPYKDGSFDAVTVGFGIRNVTDIGQVFSEVLRVLVPSGRFVILEFSHPLSPFIRFLYALYSRIFVTGLGRLISKDDQAYEYLPESIRKFHDQEGLKNLLRQSGFIDVAYENKSGGIVAIHHGKKHS